MIHKIFSTLFIMDTTTLLCILVWGNLLSPILIFSYHSLIENINNKPILSNIIRIRLLYALGYFLILFRGTLPDLLSVNLGNTLNFIGFFLDLSLILKMARLWNNKIKLSMISILSISILLFNILEFIYASSSLRVISATTAIFCIYFIPTVLLTAKNNISHFQRSVGIFYVFLLFALLIRFISALGGEISLLSQHFSQSLFLLALIMIMINNIIIQFLLIKEENDNELHLLATTDHLTGLLNRRCFLQQVELKLAASHSSMNEITILFLDIDFFKEANDTYGHAFGDEVLAAFAEVLKQNLRQSDLSCRYGGEEFVIFLPSSQDSALHIAERILQKTREIQFESTPDYKCAASIGIASGTYSAQNPLSDLIRNADTAMYHAKQEGRNRLVIYTEGMSIQ